MNVEKKWTFLDSARSDECIDFTMMCVFFVFVSVYSIISRNNAPFSNFRGGFRWKKVKSIIHKNFICTYFVDKPTIGYTLLSIVYHSPQLLVVDARSYNLNRYFLILVNPYFNEISFKFPFFSFINVDVKFPCAQGISLSSTITAVRF
ncbi:Uncharacterized protein FWK35_00020756 [Aphis craccivora]|uniref:Uncharacterized protein n=1 Tax=Aphis craccivora TaxID=307492 RepID=A0A6G0YLB0_APHCR|nr:Uncharacterized protein FWK35_00020756 [Aphis craccivora]